VDAQNVQVSDLTSHSIFGIKPPSIRLIGGYADGGSALPADSAKDDGAQAETRAGLLGLKTLISPHHSIVFWIVAGIGGLVVLNGSARSGGSKKKK
jgi:hypothetical protein